MTQGLIKCLTGLFQVLADANIIDIESQNSWGTEGPYGGLEYISYKFFRKKTVAVEMTKEAYGLP